MSRSQLNLHGPAIRIAELTVDIALVFRFQNIRPGLNGSEHKVSAVIRNSDVRAALPGQSQVGLRQSLVRGDVGDVTDDLLRVPVVQGAVGFTGGNS